MKPVVRTFIRSSVNLRTNDQLFEGEIHPMTNMIELTDEEWKQLNSPERITTSIYPTGKE